METKLSWISRYLTAWILIAMAGGIILGIAFPGLPALLDSVQIENVHSFYNQLVYII